MRLGTIALLGGILLFQQMPRLPDGLWLWPILLSLPLTFLFKPLRLLIWLAAGFLLAWGQAVLLLQQPLDPLLEGRDITIEGTVDSFVERGDRRVRFEFEPSAVVTPGIGLRQLPKRLRLSWYAGDAPVRAGERWRLTVRLKRPHGFANPGGFDYERWLFRKGIGATGYVRHREEKRRLAAATPGLLMLRAALAGRIEQVAGERFGPLLSALAVGARHDIGEVQWQTLVATGTNHLMAISGLHVGLVAGLFYFLAGWLWRRSRRLPLLLATPRAAALAALAAAALYAAMAGFSVPTQRALAMLTAGLIALVLTRHQSASRALALALLVVLVVDPLAVLDAGFWLSFAAVAVILYGARRAGTKVWRWLALQGVISLAIAPLSLLMFQHASLISPLANLVAVPWVGTAVVPPLLAGVALLPLAEPLGSALISLAGSSLALLWPLLEWLESVPGARLFHAVPDPWLLVPALVGVAWLCAPRGVPARWVGLLWLAPLLWWPLERPPEGGFDFTLLDVGQGLAAVVETRGHLLLFDAGPRFGSGFDTGEAVVLPFLRQRGWRAIDTLIVSHGDIDHRGGVESILGAMEVERLLNGSGRRFGGRLGEPCRAGQRWHWDGVDFEILSPPAGVRWNENDRSCVLRVAGEGGTLLIGGDIERRAESELARRGGIGADLLVAPHHGSDTSSTPPFIEAVEPEYVLFAAGYRNRWGFPRPQVVERYRAAGATVLATGGHGAILFEVGRQGYSDPVSWRHQRRRYWHHQATP